MVLYQYVENCFALYCAFKSFVLRNLKIGLLDTAACEDEILYLKMAVPASLNKLFENINEESC